MHVGLEVAVRKVAHSLVVGYKDVYSFKNRPVLNDDIVRLCNLQKVLKALSEEIGLQIVGPPFYVLIIILEIGIVGNGLEFRRSSIMLCKHSCESCLSTTDVSGYSYMHICSFFKGKYKVNFDLRLKADLEFVYLCKIAKFCEE